MIATADIGRIAAEAIGDQWPGVRILYLEGPERYSPIAVAEQVSKAVGEPVQAAEIPETEWANAIAGQGFSSAATAGFIEMTQGLNSGHIAFEERQNIERRMGRLTLDRLIKALVAGNVPCAGE